jgi:hypothetical protein
MAKLTRVRERVHGVLLFVTPHSQVLNDDVSWVITHIAAPPVDDVLHEDNDWLEIMVGDRKALRHPVRYLMDLYQRDLTSPIEHQRQIQQQLSVLLDGFLSGKVGVEDERLRLIYRLQAQVNAQLKQIVDARAYLGIRLQRALLVPPRQSLGARCTSDRKVRVYLSGLYSRDV